MADASANPSSSNSPGSGAGAAAGAAAAAAEPWLDALREQGAELLPRTQDDLPAIRVERAAWPSLVAALKRDPRLSFEMLVDLAAVDFPRRTPRFEVVYHLWSLTWNRILRVKVGVPEEDPSVASVTALWGTADWHEREAFDLMGLRFDGHSDLRRILMPDDYPWHPLRKDFPVEGIDNSISYVRAGGVLMTRELDVDRPAGQDRTPVDLSSGDPPGYSDGAATQARSGSAD